MIHLYSVGNRNHTQTVKLSDQLKKEFAITDISLPLQYYDGYADNTHHITTECWWTTIIPIIFRDIGVNYVPSDFKLTPMFDGAANISFHSPIADGQYFYQDIHGNTYHGGHLATVRNLSSNQLTGYHRLYRGAHTCSTIINETIDSKIVCLVNCDSMAIPFIPILATQCKQVIAIDCRGNMNVNKFITECSTCVNKFISLFAAFHWNLGKFGQILQ